jgi:ribosome modulation factor
MIEGQLDLFLTDAALRQQQAMEAYDRGRMDAVWGDGHRQNPYTDTGLHRMWLRGWQAVRA